MSAGIIISRKLAYLLVRKHEEKGFSELILTQHALHYENVGSNPATPTPGRRSEITARLTFLARLGDTLPIV